MSTYKGLLDLVAVAIASSLGDNFSKAFDCRADQRVCKASDGTPRAVSMPSKDDYRNAAQEAFTVAVEFFNDGADNDSKHGIIAAEITRVFELRAKSIFAAVSEGKIVGKT